MGDYFEILKSPQNICSYYEEEVTFISSLPKDIAEFDNSKSTQIEVHIPAGVEFIADIKNEDGDIYYFDSNMGFVHWRSRHLSTDSIVDNLEKVSSSSFYEECKSAEKTLSSMFTRYSIEDIYFSGSLRDIFQTGVIEAFMPVSADDVIGDYVVAEIPLSDYAEEPYYSAEAYLREALNNAAVEWKKQYYKKPDAQLQQVVDALKFASPKYAGAPYPPFDSLAINLSRIPENLRAKDVDISVKGDKVSIDWITQEEVDSTRSLYGEIARAFTAVKKQVGYGKPFEVRVHVVSRDGRRYGEEFETLTIK